MSTLLISQHKLIVPCLAAAGLAAISILAINQDVDEAASAANSTSITGTISYEDQYITISNNSQVDLGTMAVNADATYAYASDAVTVSTNVSTGYELYLSSADKTSAALTADNGYNTPITATSGTGGELGTPATLDDNSYGYAVPSGLIGNNNFNADYASPTSSSKFAGVPAGHQDRIRSSSTATDGETTNVYYGANVNNALAPGQYSGSVTYSAVVTPTSGTYTMSVSPTSGNVGTEITIVSGPTTINTSTNLEPSEVEVYFRKSSVTKGTCNVTNVDTSSGHLITTCNAPYMTIGGAYDIVVSVPRYGFKDTKTNTFTYTVYGTMQDFTTSQCSSLTTYNSSSPSSTTYRFADTRDGNLYQIRKFTDGHCWMVQDLRLGKTTAMTLYSTNTDITTSSWVLPASAGNSNLPWTRDYTAAYMHIGTTNDSNWNSAYGNYYNWYAATAGTGTGDMDIASGDATSSICPKGWKLPKDYQDSTYSWKELYTSYNNATNFRNYTNTGTGYWPGYYIDNNNDGQLISAGTSGSWWTRRANGASQAFVLYTYSSSVNYDSYSDKYKGNPIRCIFIGS